MAAEKISKTKKEEKPRKPVYLDPSEVDPADIDSSAETLYFEKCRYIDSHPLVETSRCYLPDFMSAVFERVGVDGVSEEPFQEIGCEKYLKWRDEEEKQLPHESYKEYQFQYNPIAFFKTKKTRKTKKEGEEQEYDKNDHRLVFKADWAGRDWLQTRRFALMSPITYVGNTTMNKNARYLYAFAIDLDGVGMEQLERLFELMLKIYPSMPHKPYPMDGHPVIPTPNIIVNSGHGLHLYYTMRYPLALHKENVPYLQEICKSLYKVVAWKKSKKVGGDPGTTKEKEVHCLGIYHAFRLPETWTKTLKVTKSSGDFVGNGVPIQAWLTEAPHYTIEDFLPYIAFSGNTQLYKSLAPSVITQLEKGGRLLNPKRLTLEQARRKYGEEWYQNREKEKGTFTINRRLYDWWLAKMKERDGVKEGFRYYCVMALAAFAKKCGIPFAELKRDAYTLIDSFDELTHEKDPFVKHDVDAAIKAYKNPNSIRWTPGMLSAWTNIPMKKTKRNHRKIEHHLEMLRAIRDLRRKQDGKLPWNKTGNNGRPVANLDNSKEAQLINEWMVNHPNSTNKSLCARELGIDRKTVRKWWVQIEDRILDAEVNTSSSIDEFMEQMEYIPANYQHVYTSDEFKKALLDPDSNIERTVVPVVPMAKLFAPNSDFEIPGYTHEEVVEIVTTGKWQELGWDLHY